MAGNTKLNRVWKNWWFKEKMHPGKNQQIIADIDNRMFTLLLSMLLVPSGSQNTILVLAVNFHARNTTEHVLKAN
jgi:hypothetical protein